MATFNEFYNNLGLTEYPFTSYTTETEGAKFAQMFTDPAEYHVMLEQYSAGASIILSGDRGTGKTALLKNFIERTNKKNTVICHITDFSKLGLSFSISDFYGFIIKNYSVALFDILSDNPKRVSNLSQDEKILLSYMLTNFVPSISKENLREKIKSIQVPKWKKWLIRLQGIFNYGANVVTNIIDEVVQHFTLPKLSDDFTIKQLFPEIKEELKDDFENQEICLELFKRIIKVSKKLQFEKLLVVMDRIDEDARFNNAAESISEFILKILSNNDIFLLDDISFVVSLWSTPFNFIKNEVRTQKHYCPVLSWRTDDLKRVLNRRLSAYSNGQIINYNSLFDDSVSDKDKDFIFYLANGSPRDLWHLLNTLFKNQFDIDSDSLKITTKAFAPAFDSFVKSFNYYEYYPKKANANKSSLDIYSYTNYLLKLDKHIFTKTDLRDKTSIGGSSIHNYVAGMERIGLIKEHGRTSSAVEYIIKDPKIIYALENNIEIKKD